MSWVKVDDGMPDHRKWASLEGNPRLWSECMAVWVAVACYSARTLSDGYADSARIERLTPLGKGAIRACKAMVDAGLMCSERAGYRIHDFTRYNPPAAKVLAEREADAERKAEKRGSRKTGAYAGSPPRTQDRTDQRTSGRTDGGDSERSPGWSPDTPRARVLPTPPHPSDSLRSSGARDVPAEAGPEPELAADRDRERDLSLGSWPTDDDSEPDESDLETRLRRGYQRRYQRETGEAWMAHAKAHEPVQRVAAWARQQPDPEGAVERFLDGAFSDPVRATGTVDRRWRDERWPWLWLAQDPGLTCSRSTLAKRPIVNSPGSSDARPGGITNGHGRPSLTETEACAYERQRERARGTRTTKPSKALELAALEAARAKGWDADADERAGWQP